jgi:hypothetical protein
MLFVIFVSNDSDNIIFCKATVYAIIRLIQNSG